MGADPLAEFIAEVEAGQHSRDVLAIEEAEPPPRNRRITRRARVSPMWEETRCRNCQDEAQGQPAADGLLEMLAEAEEADMKVQDFIEHRDTFSYLIVTGEKRCTRCGATFPVWSEG